MRSHDCLLRRLLLAFSAVALACNGDDLSAPLTGTLEVTTTTTGLEPDGDGYTIQVDDGQPQPIAPNAKRQVAGLTAASHTVRLSGLADNCSVLDDNPRTASVISEQVTTIVFYVTCSATPA